MTEDPERCIEARSLPRAEFGRRYARVLGGLAPPRTLDPSLFAEPYAGDLAAAIQLAIEERVSPGRAGEALDVASRLGALLDGSQRRVALRQLLWCLSNAPPPPERSLLRGLARAVLGRPDLDAIVRPFATSAALQAACAAHGSELLDLLALNGLSEWASATGLDAASLSDPRDR